MKCPACYNELTPRRAGQITVDVCDGGCGGIWFDNFELKRVDAGDAAALAEIWRDQNDHGGLREEAQVPALRRADHAPPFLQPQTGRGDRRVPKLRRPLARCGRIRADPRRAPAARTAASGRQQRHFERGHGAAQRGALNGRSHGRESVAD